MKKQGTKKHPPTQFRTYWILAVFLLCSGLSHEGMAQSRRTPSSLRYDAIDLGVGYPLAGPNNKTHAVGFRYNTEGVQEFLFYDGERLVQLELPGPPFDLNDRDEMLLHDGRVFKPEGESVITSVLAGRKINNLGFIVGYATVCWLPEGTSTEYCGGVPALISPGGAVTPLEADYQRPTEYLPLALNDRHEIVGLRWVGSPPIHIAVYQAAPGAPVQDIPVPPAELGHLGWRINDSGQIIIQTFGRASQDYLYSGGRLIPIGTLFEGGSASGIALNRWGTVVGLSSDLPTTSDAFLFDGKIHNLNDLIPVGFPLHVASAVGINDFGEILAVGLPKNGASPDSHHMLLLKPNSTVRYYYGIGDSVASGHGLDGDNGTGCRQTLGAYPNLVPSKADGSLLPRGNFACSGATSEDLPSQITSVINDLILVRQRNPLAQAIVSITIGANDLHWSDFLSLSNLLCSPDVAYSEMKQQIMSRVFSGLHSGVERLLNQDIRALVSG